MILKRLLMVDRLLSSREMTGEATERDKSPYLAKILHLEIEVKITLDADDLSMRLDKFEDMNVFQLMKLLNLTTLALPPLYVGITVDQTLSTRYKQHQSDFDANQKSALAVVFLKMVFVGQISIFSAICLPTSMIDRNSMEFAEYILHAFGKPLFS